MVVLSPKVGLEMITGRQGTPKGQVMPVRVPWRCLEEVRLLEQGRDHRASAWDGVLN